METVNRVIKKEWSYFFLLSINFYLFPLLVKEYEEKMLMFFIIMPVICFVCGVIKGMKEGFDFILLLGVTLLFLSSVPIYYNQSASIFSFSFFVSR